ncbi:MAG: tyrosine-type recombinase/integrase [Alphaproteobacteria bacterium]|nr:tyrosine-type recombinase/integrase [Alphaproteobacteria bacterium]
MPKPRNPENKGLPTRWRLAHGAYYFQVPPGMEAFWNGKKLFRLGKTLPEAYRVWADRIGTTDKRNNIGQLLDRYALQVIPTKAPKTQAGYKEALPQLRNVFGDVPLLSIRPQHIYQYIDKRKSKKSTNQNARVRARREIAVLSHALTKAVEWGYIARHPFKGEVRLTGEKPRTRYIEDWEIVECLSLPSVRKKGSVQAIQAYIRLKLLTGMRRGDLLRLRISTLDNEGIKVTTHKSGKPVVYEWTEELKEAVNIAKAARPVDISPYLFCTQRGESYLNEDTGEAPGWASMWQRFMTRVMTETKVTERFTEHDLRAKCASDAKTLDHARSLLAHADSRITERVYRRKPERVMPLR